jgi:hypothetical protein
VALVGYDVSGEPKTSIIRGTRIGELGTTLAITSNRRTLLRNTISHRVSVAHIYVYRNTRIGTHFSDSFPMQKGLKQGDALSPLLFNFTLE